MQLYEVMRERMIDPPPREQFILFLDHNTFAYGMVLDCWY
jgi:hypothetical protein